MSEALGPYDALILDLDGCVWIGGQPTPGAVEALATWRDRGGRLVFATNEPRRSPEAQVQRLWALGIRASADEIVTAGSAVQSHLAAHHPGARVFVIGSEALIRHVGAGGGRVVNNTGRSREESADVVVVGGHDRLTYDELVVATRAVLGGAPLIATGRDNLVPHPEGPVPGTGAVVAAIECATGATALALGKPAPEMFRIALDRLGATRVLVVGDRLDSDIAGAASAGLDGALVLTGTADSSALSRWDGAPPVAVAPTLAALLASLPPPG